MSASLKAARMGGRGYRPGARVVQGDPGLFGAIGGALKGGIGAIFRGGNPITGAIGGAVSGWKGGGGSGGGPVMQSRPGTQPVPLPALPQVGSMPVIPTPGVAGLAQRLVPGGRTGFEVAMPAPAMNGGRPAGYHLNKTGYWLRDGTYVPPQSRWVKNRRRNPLNPRALRRAVARIDAGKVWQGKMREISTGKYTAAGTRK